MAEVEGILWSMTAWAMLMLVSPILGAVLGRYLGVQLGKNPNVAYRGALGAVAGYCCGLLLAAFGIWQTVTQVLELISLLFPHLN